MHQIVSTEIIILLTSFIIYYKFHYERKFISLLFKKVVIYLPLTDNDYEQLIQIKKDKNKNIQAIVRSCEIDEYALKAQDENFYKFDLIVLFYLCNLTTVLINEIKNIFIAVFLKEDIISVNTFNVISSFVLISFTYFIYLNLRFFIFKEGFKKIEAKTFYVNFTICFISFLLIQIYKEEFLNFNYNSVLEIINDRIYSILSYTEYTFKNEKNMLSKIHIQILFSIIFSLYTSILYRPSMRYSYFDHFLLMACDKAEDENIKNSKLELVIKFKSICNIFSLFLLLEPISNFLFDYFNIFKTYSNAIIIIFLFISSILELICGIHEIWYIGFMFHTQNYNEILKFSKNPSKEQLKYHRLYMTLVNTRFWDIISHIFYLVFIPILILICYFSRSNIIQTLIFKKKLELKKYLLEDILYIILLSFSFAKAIIQNGNLFYTIFMKIIHVPLY